MVQFRRKFNPVQRGGVNLEVVVLFFAAISSDDSQRVTESSLKELDEFDFECSWRPVAEVVEYAPSTDWVYCVVEVQIKTSYSIKYDHLLDGYPVDVGRALMPGLKM